MFFVFLDFASMTSWTTVRSTGDGRGLGVYAEQDIEEQTEVAEFVGMVLKDASEHPFSEASIHPATRILGHFSPQAPPCVHPCPPCSVRLKSSSDARK